MDTTKLKCTGCGSEKPWDGYAPGDALDVFRRGGKVICDTADCYEMMEAVEEPATALPSDSAARKTLPIATGVLDYFPAALAEIAKLSKAGNDKHNPGQDLHWSRGKSSDHADCIVRHLIDRGVIDPEDRLSHTVKVAWRALALLQEECESRGAPMARGARPA